MPYGKNNKKEMHNMKLKTILATTMAGLMLIAAGCGGGGDKKAAPAGKTQDFKGKKLVMYVSFHEDTAKGLAELFKQKTGAEVSFIRLPTGEATARLLAEKDNPKASLWIGGPSDAHELMKAKGVTEKYESPNLKLIPAEFKDKDAYWAGVYIEALAIGVNQDRYDKEFKGKVAMPTKLEDLLNPAFKGEIITPDPKKSGTGYTFIASLVQQMGEEKAMAYLKNMKKNVAQYTPSGFTPAQKVGAGEYLICLNFLEDQTLVSSKGQKLHSTVYPDAGWTSCAMSKIANKNDDDALVNAFFDFCLTKEAGAIISKTTSAISCNPEVAPPAGVPLLKDMPLNKKFDIKKAGEMKKSLLEKYSAL